MKKILITGVMLMSTPFVLLAQTTTTGTIDTPAVTTTTIAEPGFVPGDFFYFIDRWTEAFNMTITFNKEKKARKHLEYAKERVAEMGEVLKDPKATIDDVADAKADFDERVTEAAALVKEEKDKGADIADLAREIDDELDDSINELRDIFNDHKDRSSRAEEEIRAKLSVLLPTDPQVQGLTQALESITKEKNNAMKEEDDLDIDLGDEQELLEELMGEELSAQKHLEQAMRLRTRLEGVAEQTPSQASEQLMRQAQEAILRGDFDAARRISDEVEKGIDVIKETIKDDVSEDISTEDVDSLEQNIEESERMIENIGM